MDDERREQRCREREGDQEKYDDGRADRDVVTLEACPEELPGGAALYLLDRAVERDEDLDSRLGLLDLAHTPLPLFTTAEV
jgi:hypothetical protein